MDEAIAGTVSATGIGVFASSSGAVAPERRKVIEITGSPETGYQSKVVKDYDVLFGIAQDVQAAMAEHDAADSDDSPDCQQYLTTAWQAMALYLANTDDEDKEAALLVLKLVSAIISDDDVNDAVHPSGNFGLTVSQTAAASSTFSCPQCSRNFGTEAGLIAHLKNVHASRAKSKFPKSKGDAPVQEKD